MIDAKAKSRPSIDRENSQLWPQEGSELQDEGYSDSLWDRLF